MAVMLTTITADGVTAGDEAATGAVTCPHPKGMRSRSRAVTRAARDTSRHVTGKRHGRCHAGREARPAATGARRPGHRQTGKCPHVFPDAQKTIWVLVNETLRLEGRARPGSDQSLVGTGA